ncbi:SDR family NAD(P)-dependent oxidoreductase [Micromonospora sp. NPDC047620]|uniref:SDR family NAD(P)-dependent oxidoreductase n=1 Tax=Micromonospora sp. NPDC047620 TaxID=3364251 RepID=UPI00371F9903
MHGSGQRLAVVTGAASGIGAAVARRLVDDGWRVIGWDRRPCDADGVTGRQVDVRDYDQVAVAAAEVERADLLVNSAGIGGRGFASELAPAAWERVIGVNLTGTYYCCRAMFPALRRAGGLVVNIASVAAHLAMVEGAAYCSSKAGVAMLTEVLGVEWAAQNIRVIAVSPGYVRTPLVMDGIHRNLLDEETIVRGTPQRRLAEPAEVAELIRALAADELRYLTATTVRFDGGWTASGGYQPHLAGDLLPALDDPPPTRDRAGATARD